MLKSTLIHLRIPFSLFLMPVFSFALSQANHPDWQKVLAVFVILHLLIYPASNAYNSYFDKDEGPIGGLENPPPVSKQLYNTALLFDFVGVLLGYFFCGINFAIAIFIYGIISKAYSHPSARLKKYPILSWLTVGVFQGAFTYLCVIQAIDNLELSQLAQNQYLFPALLSSLNLLGFYPMTQIYQHQEDAQRGDTTMSILLGIRGTFIFTASIFALVTLGFILFFQQNPATSLQNGVKYFVSLSPVVTFFGYWLLKTFKNQAEANFKNTMILNLLGSVCLNFFFFWLLFSKN
jgi:hypothetical protein